MKSENWRRWIPTDIDPKATGHTQDCEDSEGRLRVAYLGIILSYAILTVFFGIWKIVGMPPGYRGDYLDLFDDVVALLGLGSGLLVLWFIRREKSRTAWRRE